MPTPYNQKRQLGRAECNQVASGAILIRRTLVGDVAPLLSPPCAVSSCHVALICFCPKLLPLKTNEIACVRLSKPYNSDL